MSEATINSTIFEQLELECKQTEEHGNRLQESVREFVRKNGSGDGIRKRLRKKLSNPELLRTCESLVKKPDEVNENA